MVHEAAVLIGGHSLRCLTDGVNWLEMGVWAEGSSTPNTDDHLFGLPRKGIALRRVAGGLQEFGSRTDESPEFAYSGRH